MMNVATGGVGTGNGKFSYIGERGDTGAMANAQY